MSYKVVAGYVTVETQVNDNGARAHVDIPRGAELPGDVPDEQVTTLLALGHIEGAGVTGEDPARPAESAAKPKWVAWAVHNGMSAEDADKLTKAQLVEQLGQHGGDE